MLKKNLRLTRRCLELIDEYGFGLAIQTKSDLILRDLDLLRSINRKTKCVVQMTLTTYDDALCRIVEPNVCTTSRRAEVLNILRDEGIPTVIWMTPILPFINDTEENIRGILDYCIKAEVYGVLFFDSIGVTLRDGDRQYFYQKLGEHFSGLKERYIRTYGNNYIVPSPNSSYLTALTRDICMKNGIVSNTDQIFHYMGRFEDKLSTKQLSLFS